MNRIKGTPQMFALAAMPEIISSFTHKIRVDGENGFTLAEGANGRTMPAKTLTDAKTLVEALLTEYGGNALIEASPKATAYAEDVVFPANTSLQGTSGNNLNINGNITFPAGNPISIRYVNFSGADKSLTLNAATSMLDVFVSGKTLVNGVVVQSYNTHLTTSEQAALELVGAAARFHSLIASIRTTGDFPAITGDGTFIGSLCNIEGGSATEYTIKSLEDGRIQLFNSVVQNPGFGACMDLRNGATAGSPNALHGVIAVGNIVCGDAATHINDLSMKFGTLSGTALIFEPDKMIANTSSWAGDTVYDALEAIAALKNASGIINDSGVEGDNVAEALDELASLISGAAGGLIWKGTWNAETNDPVIESGVGENGWYYRVNVAGNTEIDGISTWAVNDWIVFNSDKGAWQRIANREILPFAQIAELNGTHITERRIKMDDKPITPVTHVIFSVEGFGMQINGRGYEITVDGSDHYVSWDGKGLDGLLAAGRYVKITGSKEA
jgi:hypothetical protein